MYRQDKDKICIHYLHQITKDKVKIPLRASPFDLLYLITKVNPLFRIDIQSKTILAHNL